MNEGPSGIERVNVLGVGLSVINLYSGLAAVAQALESKTRGYVCVTGVHGVMEAQQDESLRRILNAVMEARSLPVLATIPPANQGFDHRSPPERNEWVAGINEEVRALAREEGALSVDLHAAFVARPSLRPLFTDHVHPSAAGFELIADSFFAALTAARSPTR